MLRREKAVENATFRAGIIVVSHRFAPDCNLNATDSPLHRTRLLQDSRLARSPSFVFICIVYESRALSIREGRFLCRGMTLSRPRNGSWEVTRVYPEEIWANCETAPRKEIQTGNPEGVSLHSAMSNSTLEATCREKVTAPSLLLASAEKREVAESEESHLRDSNPGPPLYESGALPLC